MKASTIFDLTPDKLVGVELHPRHKSTIEIKEYKANENVNQTAEKM